jgi:hypothetical protein
MWAYFSTCWKALKQIWNAWIIPYDNTNMTLLIQAMCFHYKYYYISNVTALKRMSQNYFQQCLLPCMAEIVECVYSVQRWVLWSWPHWLMANENIYFYTINPVVRPCMAISGKIYLILHKTDTKEFTFASFLYSVSALI